MYIFVFAIFVLFVDFCIKVLFLKSVLVVYLYTCDGIEFPIIAGDEPFHLHALIYTFHIYITQSLYCCCTLMLLHNSIVAQ